MNNIFYISYIVLWILLMFQGVLLLLIYRHFGLATLGTMEGVQRDGVPVGTVAPSITGRTVQGESIRWSPKKGGLYLLMFVSPDCEPCARILPYVRQLTTAYSDMEIALIVSGAQDSVDRVLDKFRLPPSITCLAEDGLGAYKSYRVRVTPFAFVIGQDQRVLAKGLCDDAAKLEQLLSVGGMEVPHFITLAAHSSQSPVLQSE